MTFDRYQVIMYPLKAMTLRTTKKAVFTNVFIWISIYMINERLQFYHIKD